MNKQSVIYLLILLIIALLIGFVLSDKFRGITQIPVEIPRVEERPTVPAPVTSGPRTMTENTVTITLPESTVSSPLKIKGQAPGNWFFEAVLGIEILDANGKSLGMAAGTATEEWMTTDLVSFEGEVAFSTSTTATGTLAIRADDPAGLGQRPSALFPIRFER